MERTKVCAVQGVAGENELAELMKFASAGWNIALMDPYREIDEQIKRVLKEKYNIRVKMINGKEEFDDEPYDIEAFFYHGSWDEEEDVDIFWGYLYTRYSEIDHIIGK